MIDEKNLIEEIKSLHMRIGNNQSDEIKTYEREYKKSVLRIIEEQSKVNEWIPVTEGLPKELERVLVAYRGYYDKKIYCDNVAYIRAGDWVWNCDEDEVVVEIVAWRLLPKPYRG